MREYPKMLYIGTAQSHKHKTARNEQHEAELRELGFVNFVDLEKEEPVNNDVGSASAEDSKNAFVPVEQFDELGERLAKAEQELNVAISENKELKQRIITLDKCLIEKDYEDKSADELREILNQREVKFGARDNKEVLVQLVVKSDPPHMYEVDQLGE